MSFVFEEGPKGAAAVKVKEEEGGVAEEAKVVEEEEEGEREMGMVRVCKRCSSKELSFCGTSKAEKV